MSIPEATHGGELMVSDIVLPCKREDRRTDVRTYVRQVLLQCEPTQGGEVGVVRVLGVGGVC